MDDLKKLINKKKVDLSKIATKNHERYSVNDLERSEEIQPTNITPEKDYGNDITDDLLNKRSDNPIDENTINNDVQNLKDSNSKVDNIENRATDELIANKLTKDFKNENEEYEALRKVILEDLNKKLPEKSEMEPKTYIKEWDYKLTSEEREAYQQHHKQFVENFKASLKYYKKFDYNKTASYSERCDDIFFFVVETINSYTQDIYQRSLNVEEAKSHIFKRELDTLRGIKNDIQYLILYLKEYVT